MLYFEISKGILTGHLDLQISMIEEKLKGYVVWFLISMLLYLCNASSEMG